MSDDRPDDVSTFNLSVPLSLDDDGFLRRECPNCEREFKWLHSPAADTPAEPMAAGGYYCPYCCKQSEDDWWTQPQADYVAAYALAQKGDDLLDPLRDSVERLNQAGGWIEAKLETDFPEPIQPEEPNDMTRVDFRCHPTEPVKVSDVWQGAVHCLICGEPAD
jgi:hypothetical protein